MSLSASHTRTLYPVSGSSCTVGDTYLQVTFTVDGLIPNTCTALGGFCGRNLKVLSKNLSLSGPGPEIEIYVKDEL